jgi:hypothetical protein
MSWCFHSLSSCCFFQTIVRELHLDAKDKTIKPADVGGVAGLGKLVLLFLAFFLLCAHFLVFLFPLTD